MNCSLGSTLLQNQARNALEEQLLLSDSFNYSHSLSLPMEIWGWEAHEATPARLAWRLPFSQGRQPVPDPRLSPRQGCSAGRVLASARGAVAVHA